MAGVTGPDYLRVGDAERDAMTASLHEHFAQGRLTSDELEERLSATLTARTVGDLRAIDHDLPRPPEPSAETEHWRPHFPPGRRPRFLFAIPFLIGFFILMAVSHDGGPSHHHPDWALFGVARFLFVLFLLGMFFRFARHRRHHRHHRF
jgi:hypothetical protein